MNRSHSHRKTLLAAFLLPFGVMLLVAVWLGVAPFGAKSLLTLDLKQQYVQFFAWLRQTAGQGLSFSTFKGIGGSMMGLIGYYLASPVNLLLFCFDVAHLPEAVLLITLVKVGLCGLGMCIFLLGRDPECAPAHALLLSGCYAFCAYVMVFSSNLMWLDCVYLLPLVALGILRVAQGRAPWLYLLSLAASVASNAYIGISVCLFSVLYFVYAMLQRPARRVWRRIGAFAAGSLLAGALSAAVWLPMLLALRGGKVAVESPFTGAHTLFSWAEFIGQLFSSEIVFEDYAGGLPNVYSGLLALLGALITLFRRDVPLRERLGSLGLLAVLAVSMWFSPLNLVWHGLNAPAWFNFRYSFLFTFVLIAMAQRGLSAQSKAPKAAPVLLSLALCGGLLTLACFLDQDTTLVTVALSGGLLAVMALWLLPVRMPRVLAAGGLALVCLADLGLHVYLPLRVGVYEDRAIYADAYAEWSAYKDVTEAQAEGFYRAEMLDNQRPNDAMLVKLHGISHYSSTDQQFAPRFMRQMGIGITGQAIRYERGTSLPADSFLGVRFLAAAEAVPQVEAFAQVDTLPSGKGVYENPYALPLAFAADAALLDLEVAGDDRLAWQNRLWADALGAGEDFSMLRPQTSYFVTSGLSAAPDESGKILYTRRDNAASSIIYTVEVQHDGPLYAFLPSGWEGENECQLLLNGQPFGSYFTPRGYGVLSLGTFRAGDTAQLTLQPEGKELLLGDACFYSLDMALFTSSVDQLRGGAFQVEQQDDTEMLCTGEIENEAGGILLVTVPATEGWRAEVDGQPAAVQAAAEALLAVPLAQGQHTVRLWFEAPGLRLGGILSLAALAVFLLWMLPVEILRWRQRSKRRAKEELASRFL